MLVQISDLHITAPGRRLLGRVDTAAYLRRCVARLGELDPSPAAVIATGDLVDEGTVAEYEALHELVASLPAPLYLMMGNHDDRAAFRAVFGAAGYLRDAAGEHIQYAFDAGPLRVIALDTNVPGRPGGTLCAARLDWLAGALDAAAGRPVVISMHHPPFATGISFMDACGLDRESAAALAVVVARHGNVERVICGHLHRPIHARFAGTIAATAPSCAHQVALDFSPDAAAALTFEPPAFVQHAWIAGALVSHHTYIDRYEGPFAY